jgi:ribonuclease Z
VNLDVTFFGTSAGRPTADRTVSGLLINRAGERLLIDPGEGTQQRMIELETGFDIGTVLLTHTHADHTLGLAGLLNTWGFDGRVRPVTVVVPDGNESYVTRLLNIVGGNLPFDVDVVETSPGSTAATFDGFSIETTEVEHRGPAVGYELIEDERTGRFDETKARTLGVEAGPKFGRLQSGESVEANDGSIVQPEQVLGPPRRGRRLLYTGDTRPVLDPVGVVTPVDVVIHEATFTSSHIARARRTGHATATEAGRVAQTLDATRLVLTHFSPRYSSQSIHKKEASTEFDGETTLARDGMQFSIPVPDS